MSLKRGEDRYHQLGRFALGVFRSSDGQWQDDEGKIVGLFKLTPIHRGDSPHDNKRFFSVIVGEYAFFVAWFISGQRGKG